MQARATLKSEYAGNTLIIVNLRGHGTDDCERKIHELSSTMNAGYWKIEFNKQFTEQTAYTLKGYTGKLQVSRAYSQ